VAAVRLLKRKPQSFDIQIQHMVLRVQASADYVEECRAAALSFWDQLNAYATGHPAFRNATEPVQVADTAPEVIREMSRAAGSAGVAPMTTMRGAMIDHVGRFLGRSVSELRISSGGDAFVVTKKPVKLSVLRRTDGTGISVVLHPRNGGVGVSTLSGDRRAAELGVDGLAVLASSCTVADAALAALQTILAEPRSLKRALAHLERIDGVMGGLVVQGTQIGVAGGVEIAA
jgi:ApbE superfamily uncharacterized protein (UPF0280 family)